jgi:mannobiose 2-epimerase
MVSIHPEQTDRSRWKREIESELAGNILPFWASRPIDRQNGGFYGALTEDLQVRNDVPRSSILCSRTLWTYAAAHHRLGGEGCIQTAKWAYDYLVRAFLDQEHGGLYWHVDRLGRPIADRKHHYAQAFGIYGLSEYARAADDPAALELAVELFQLLERHAWEPRHGGYTEASSRDWGLLADMRLSEKDLHCRKSMNTMLHILEAYTNLLRAWDDPDLRRRHRDLIDIFLDRIIAPGTGHFRLFFDDAWNSLSRVISYGHDIEGSWLLVEAAAAQADPALMERVRAAAVRLAEAALNEGLDPDGSLRHEGGPGGDPETPKEWWAQAEGMVGFYNAYEITGEVRFAIAAARLWAFIQEKVIDRVHGDWHKILRRDGAPAPEGFKAGPWECPYHHARACLEMIERLEAGGGS